MRLLSAVSCAGYTEVKPMVFCGLFPTDNDQFETLRDSLGKLQLNDAALVYEPEVGPAVDLGEAAGSACAGRLPTRARSQAAPKLCRQGLWPASVRSHRAGSHACARPQMSSSLGFGFRCGFLGLLHMDIVRERLEREYDLDLIITAPSVVYHAILESGEVVPVQNPSAMPDMGGRRRIEEPYVKCALQRWAALRWPAQHRMAAAIIVNTSSHVLKHCSWPPAQDAPVRCGVPTSCCVQPQLHPALCEAPQPSRCVRPGWR